MLPSQNIDPITVRRVRELIRENFSTRDELYSVAETLSDDDLAEICRRLADKLGGHVAHLQQLLMAAGNEPVQPQSRDEIVRHLQGIVVELLDEKRGQRAVLDEAKAAEQKLKKEYDDAIEAVPDPEVEGLLRKQREEVAFGETVLSKVQAPTSNATPDKD